MAKVFNTSVELKPPYGEEPIAFSAPEVYQQAHAHQDIHAFTEANGVVTEVFIPWEKVAAVNFSVTDSESTAPKDAFCGGEA